MIGNFLGNYGWSIDIPYALRSDEYSASVNYVGIAKVGTLDADSIWQIKRITVSGTVTKIEYAQGNAEFKFVWDNRLSYSYS